MLISHHYVKLRNFGSKWPWTQTKILLWACVETIVQTSLLYFYFYFNLKLYFFLLPPLAHPSPLITTSSTCRRSPPPPTNDTPFFSYLFFFFSPSILPTKLIFPFLHLLPATSHCQPTTPCPSVPLMAQPY